MWLRSSRRGRMSRFIRIHYWHGFHRGLGRCIWLCYLLWLGATQTTDETPSLRWRFSNGLHLEMQEMAEEVRTVVEKLAVRLCVNFWEIGDGGSLVEIYVKAPSRKMWSLFSSMRTMFYVRTTFTCYKKVKNEKINGYTEFGGRWRMRYIYTRSTPQCARRAISPNYSSCDHVFAISTGASVLPFYQ
jgi:hypothetical protein